MGRWARLAAVTSLLLILSTIHSIVVHAGVYLVREEGRVLFVEPDWRGFQRLLGELEARKVDGIYVVHACAANYTRLVESSTDERIAGYVGAALSGRCESKPLPPPYNVIFAGVVQGVYRCGDAVVLVLYSARGVRVYTRTTGGEAKLGIVYHLAYTRDEYERVERLAELLQEASEYYHRLVAEGVAPREALQRVLEEYGVPPSKLVVGRLPVAEIIVDGSIAGMLGEAKLVSLIEARLGGAPALLAILSRECTGAESHGATRNSTSTASTGGAAGSATRTGGVAAAPTPSSTAAGGAGHVAGESGTRVEHAVEATVPGATGSRGGSNNSGYVAVVLAVAAVVVVAAAYALARRR